MSNHAYTGFELRHGRAVARFRRGEDGDSRAIPLDAAVWIPAQEDEQPHPDLAVHARLIRAAAQLAAVARTMHVVCQDDEARRPIARRRRGTAA